MANIKIAGRTNDIIKYMTEDRPYGCIELAAHFGVSRSTMKTVLHAGTPEHFQLYQAGNRGRTGRESLYVLAASEREAPQAEWPSWWPRADELLSRAFRAMVTNI